MQELEAIAKYSMTPDEAKAYKIALMYCQLVKELFPDERNVKMAAGKDPRKSGLFRYCYKLTIETRGLIPDHEYGLYIRAQLEVLKQISDGKVHAMITPQCLVGDKAWTRWLMWKRRYDKMAAKPPQAAEAGVSLNERRVTEDVMASIRFLRQQGGDQLDWLKLKLTTGDIARWVSNASITPYYLAFHRELREAISDEGFAQYGLTIDQYLTVNNPSLESSCWDVIQGKSDGFILISRVQSPETP